jgi:hypothetical protein
MLTAKHQYQRDEGAFKEVKRLWVGLLDDLNRFASFQVAHFIVWRTLRKWRKLARADRRQDRKGSPRSGRDTTTQADRTRLAQTQSALLGQCYEKRNWRS